MGAMATSSLDHVAILLGRIFDNKMEYDFEQPRPGRLRHLRNTHGSTVRLQTDDELLRETFWKCYNRPAAKGERIPKVSNDYHAQLPLLRQDTACLTTR